MDWKIVGGLVPFFTSVIIHFLLYGDNDEQTVTYAIIKCLPVTLLIVFQSTQNWRELCDHGSPSLSVLIGLVFSAIGDVVMVWDLYQYGLVSFAVGHIFYIKAFGFTPFDLKKFCVAAAVGVAAYLYIIPHITGMLLHILVPLYVILIFTMAWRASAGVSYLSSWQDIFGSIGAVLFVISDCTIAINLFVRTVTNSHRIIMYTYYAAQVLITLSSLPPSSPSG